MTENHMWSLNSDTQQIYYGNSVELEPTAAQIGEMISAINRLTSADLTKIVQRLIPELDSIRFELHVQRYQSGGSGELEWFFTVLFGETMEENAKLTHEQLCKKHPQLMKLMKNKGAIFILMSMILAGGIGGAGYLIGKGSGDTINIEGNYNTVITNGAQLIGVDRNELKEAVEERTQHKRTKQDASRIIAPALRDPEASIVFNGSPELTLKPELIRALNFASLEPDEKQEHFKSVDIELRATDRDNPDRWAAIVPQIHEERHHLHIRIKRRASLAGVVNCTGDVMVHYKRVNNEWIVTHYDLTALHATDRQGNMFLDQENQDED